MKSILIPTGGADSDESVFQTAFAAARPFTAHLNFLHVCVGAGQAAMHSPHADFASGPALRSALDKLETEAKSRSVAAAQHFRDFCAGSNIAICDAPHSSLQITASLQEEKNNPLQRIVFHARHNDLIVAGRAKKPNGLPSDFLERLVLGCGRPVLIASSTPPRTLTGTVMVCWRETADAARAVTAAMPFLMKAKRAIFASVAESTDNVTDAMKDMTKQFSWSGIPAEAKLITSDGRAPQALLSAAAEACGADLVVMGAYGHSRLRETLFGGCTQAFIGNADKPVLLMH